MAHQDVKVSGRELEALYDEEEKEILKILAQQSNDAEEKVDYAETIDTLDQDEIVLGIDLGTSNSCVSVFRNGKVEVLGDERGAKTLPSVVAFGSREMFIGQEAKNQIAINPANSFYAVKRLIGRSYDDSNVQKELPYLSYRVDNIDNRIQLTGTRKRLYPEEVSATILNRLREIADRKLNPTGEPKTWKVVITIPAYFNDAQREATKVAAKIAGLDCIRIINEPTAAALAYGMTKRDKRDMVIVVYDLGGGTLDVSMMRINVEKKVFQVLASTGNTRLGGEDFDHRLVDYCKDWFSRKFGYANLDDLSATSFQLLKRKCERAKCLLSQNDKTQIIVPDFYDGKDLALTITRKRFEEICRDLFIICMKPIDDVMRRSGIDKELISEIILVGGCTRMPKIVENLQTYFGKAPNNSVDPDLVVSIGAAIHGHMITHADDPYSSTVLLLDVTPLSLGIENSGGTMSVIIGRNTVVPTSVTKRYTTDTNFMTSIPIVIYEGERKLVKNNHKLGSFELADIDPAPRGVPQIMVTFTVDLNGVLDVVAVDQRDDSTQREIRIAGNKGRLSNEEIERLVAEAKEHRLLDNLAREISYLKYEIKELCDTIIENLNSDDNNLRSEDRELIRTDVARITAWLKEMIENANIAEMGSLSDGHDRDAYKDISDKIKRKYATLILRQNKKADMVNEFVDQVTGTTVFNDDQDVETDNGGSSAAIQDEDLFEEQADDSIKKQIMQLRSQLIDLYMDLRTALKQKSSLRLTEEDIIELNEIVDDTELWIHSTGPVKPIVYEIKIRDLNSKCNEVMEKYENNIYQEAAYEITPVQELETLCYALRGVVNNQHGVVSKAGTIALNMAVDDVLEWIYIKRLDSGGESGTIVDFSVEEQAAQDSRTFEPGECYEKMAMLNKLSEVVYNRSQRMNVEGTIGPLGDSVAGATATTSTMIEVLEL